MLAQTIESRAATRTDAAWIESRGLTQAFLPTPAAELYLARATQAGGRLSRRGLSQLLVWTAPGASAGAARGPDVAFAVDFSILEVDHLRPRNLPGAAKETS